MTFDDTGLPWVMPSPNMPTPDTALVYPGQCLIEGTNVSEGRGTTRPFEIVGAPFLDGHAWAAALAEAPPCRASACGRSRSGPTFHKFAGKACGGVQLHVVDAAAFRPYRTGVALIAAARELGGDALPLADRAVRVRRRSARHRSADRQRRGPHAAIERGAPIADIEAMFAPFERAFAELRRAGADAGV